MAIALDSRATEPREWEDIYHTGPGTLAGRIQQCYPVGGRPSLVQLTLHRRLVTMLGTGAPLTNGALASEGNAARTCSTSSIEAW